MVKIESNCTIETSKLNHKIIRNTFLILFISRIIYSLFRSSALYFAKLRRVSKNAISNLSIFIRLSAFIDSIPNLIMLLTFFPIFFRNFLLRLSAAFKSSIRRRTRRNIKNKAKCHFIYCAIYFPFSTSLISRTKNYTT